MTHTPSRPEDQACKSALMVIFDAPAELREAFFENQFKPYGRQHGAWCRLFADPAGEEARDLEYEITGVGMVVRWRSPSHPEYQAPR